MWLASTVVASWSLTQVVTDSSPYTVMTNISVTELTENIYGELNYEPLKSSKALCLYE